MISKSFTFFKISLALFIFIFASGFTVIGHRGDPINAPEETFESFNKAFKEGADYVELDLHVSKDNVLVVSHDRNLERVTGTSEIVSQNNFSQIATLKQKNGESMHSLNQVFEHYKNNPNAKFLIETKKTKKGNPQNMESLLKQAIDQYNMKDRIMFHSFSTKSLQNEAELMPDIPRIFIAGTIKRVNFDVLQYVTGVNLSSSIITPQIIDTLHYMGKSVYVWDEMNESPKKWNTLINMPIDGVVTNYPATGNDYRDLKEQSKNEKLNQNVFYMSTKEEPIYENPYRLIKTKKVVKPLDGYHITNIIKFNGKKYVQLGENEFANASGFNSEYVLSELRPYFGAKAIFRNQQANNFLYSDPTDPSSIINRLEPNKAEQILTIQKIGSQTWLRLKDGWINAENVLIQLNPNNYLGNNSKESYYNLPRGQRIKNIDLMEDIAIAQPDNNQQSLKNTDLIKNFNNIFVDYSFSNDNDSINHI
ncbi:glycerophosphodiester phosphodiesterase [Companilactobacillus halodurans]|uniref:Glycerophosphodiester phosphodiesterase n=1 Tax=Companilactobacillus halodurans TaxID=2584183 RepID=A0A5P0ZQZ3_9LACO|nr:glycerophosphodiester phosphodiesterase [Companilactobacillus halodurans]MQS76529.1 glycerophosphodiester phosphodiesterase [Companilactobacillus halodurans]MQS96910.1 glycerophosphodiester phosphodiesterase [Companilactobacillus halodurans]